MTWWRRLISNGRMEEQLERELRFHLEEHTADLVARGLDPEEARRRARIELGGPEQVKEACRDARGTRWIEDLWQDFRYAVRILWRRPGFATVALLTLALGIGGATVMFTVINSVLLKPLPYAEPGRLLKLQEKTAQPTKWGDLWAFAYPNFLDCRRESRSLAMAAWRYGGGTVTKPGEPDYVEGREISSGLFTVLGVPLWRGRGFLPEEDRMGAAPVAVISYGLWQRRFAGSPEAIGKPLVFEGQPHTVVGIAPPGFRLLGDEVDVFTPIGQDSNTLLQSRLAHPGIQVVARMRPGARLGEAQEELALIGRRLAEQYPRSNQNRSFIAEPLRPPVEDVSGTLWLLLGAVTVLLLIACVNLASLLLARAVSRERELAMRAALGAGWGRLMRQCLTESAVLALSGGLLGLLLAAAGFRPFVAFWPGGLPRAGEIRPDWHVLAFAVAVSLSSGLLFGLAPALRVPVRALEQTLRAGARTVSGASRRLHSGFVAAEIALAVVLLVSAGMLARTLLRLSSLDPGLDVRNVLTARLALSPDTLGDTERTRAAWQEVLERARRVPGVRGVTMVDTVPMREGNNQIGYWITPAQPPENEQPLALATCVTPEYLKVMGIPLRQGRFFDDHDRLGSEPVAVIDEVLARQSFGGRSAIGQHLSIGLGNDPLRIVGVVGHVRYWGPAGDDQSRVRAQIYYPFLQLPERYVRRWSELMSVAVRTEVEPFGLAEPLRRELRRAGGDQVLYEVRTMEQLAGSALARQRFLLLLFGIFGGLALLLACTGIYGVLAYLTNQRVPEFGVRMALGASAGDVMRMVLRQSLGMILTGVGVGVAAALATGRILERLVEGMRPAEPSTLAVMILVLVLAALFASFLPARRASRVDPMKALRQE
jgi:predicted permease